MIRKHDFNSRWWGSDVGIVADDAFFDLRADERARALAPWAWVEYRAPLGAMPDDVGDGAGFGGARAARVARTGFACVDVQERFRIGLAKLEATPSVERLEARFADEEAFSVPVSALQDFRHERFLAVPGATSERVNERYALWSAELLAASPDTCLEVREGGEPQGWFLGRATQGGLELTLAMLHREARITGHHLYHRALLAYRDRGVRVGFAGFSAANTAVHNVYASLGARFQAPEACHLWWPAH